MRAMNAAVTAFALTLTLATAGGVQANTAVRAARGQEAAVDHQQPAASDKKGTAAVEGGVGTTPELQKEEHALDRELNSEICRGC